MPSTPKRKTILDAMNTAFAAIASPTYHTDVANVARTVKDLGCPHPSMCPMILFFPDADTVIELEGQNTVHSVMRVLVIGYVEGTSQDDRDDKIAELEDDLHRVIMGNQKWGTASYRTDIVITVTSEADTDDNPIGKVEMVVEVYYEREITPL